MIPEKLALPFWHSEADMDVKPIHDQATLHIPAFKLYARHVSVALALPITLFTALQPNKYYCNEDAFGGLQGEHAPAWIALATSLLALHTSANWSTLPLSQRWKRHVAILLLDLLVGVCQVAWAIFFSVYTCGVEDAAWLLRGPLILMIWSEAFVHIGYAVQAFSQLGKEGGPLFRLNACDSCRRCDVCSGKSGYERVSLVEKEETGVALQTGRVEGTAEERRPASGEV